MNLKRTLPVNKKAWFAFSSTLFSLAWLLWIPVQSKQLLYFWQLWPMLVAESDNRGGVAMMIAVSSLVFLVVAIFVGWILQFAWSLILSIFQRA